MKAIILSLAFFTGAIGISAQLERPLTLADLGPLAGEWEGTLENGSGDKMQSTFFCEQKGNKLKVKATHTNEKGKTEKEHSAIRVKDGIHLDFNGLWLVTSAQTNPESGKLKLVLQRGGEIDGERSMMRKTIEAHDSKLMIKYEVQRPGQSSFVTKQRRVYKKVKA